jgi:hypothetical protein
MLNVLYSGPSGVNVNNDGETTTPSGGENEITTSPSGATGMVTLNISHSPEIRGDVEPTNSDEGTETFFTGKTVTD